MKPFQFVIALIPTIILTLDPYQGCAQQTDYGDLTIKKVGKLRDVGPLDPVEPAKGSPEPAVSARESDRKYKVFFESRTGTGGWGFTEKTFDSLGEADAFARQMKAAKGDDFKAVSKEIDLEWWQRDQTKVINDITSRLNGTKLEWIDVPWTDVPSLSISSKRFGEELSMPKSGPVKLDGLFEPRVKSPSRAMLDDVVSGNTSDRSVSEIDAQLRQKAIGQWRHQLTSTTYNIFENHADGTNTLVQYQNGRPTNNRPWVTKWKIESGTYWYTDLDGNWHAWGEFFKEAKKVR